MSRIVRESRVLGDCGPNEDEFVGEPTSDLRWESELPLSKSGVGWPLS